MRSICWLCHHKRDLISFNTDDESQIHQDYIRRMVEVVVGVKFTPTMLECICVYCSVEVYNFYVFRHKSLMRAEEIQELIEKRSSPSDSEYESLEEDVGTHLPTIEELKQDFVPWLKLKLPTLTEAPQTVNAPEPNPNGDKGTQVDTDVMKDQETQCSYPETHHKRVQYAVKTVDRRIQCGPITENKRIQCRLTTPNSDKQIQCDTVVMEDKQTSTSLMIDQNVQCETIMSTTNGTQVEYILRLDKQVECKVNTKDQVTQTTIITNHQVQTEDETVLTNNKRAKLSTKKQRKHKQSNKAAVNSPSNNVMIEDKQTMVGVITSGNQAENNLSNGVKCKETPSDKSIECQKTVLKRKRKTSSSPMTRRKSSKFNKSTVDSPSNALTMEDKRTSTPIMSDKNVQCPLNDTQVNNNLIQNKQVIHSTDGLIQCVGTTMGVQHHKETECKSGSKKEKRASTRRKSVRLSVDKLAKCDMTQPSITQDKPTQCNDANESKETLPESVSKARRRSVRLSVDKLAKCDMTQPSIAQDKPTQCKDANESKETLPESVSISPNLSISISDSMEIKEEEPSPTEILHVDAEGVLTSLSPDALQFPSVETVTKIRYKKCGACNTRFTEREYYKHRRIVHLTCPHCKVRCSSFKKYDLHISTVCDVKLNAPAFVSLSRVSVNGRKRCTSQTQNNRRKTK